uniref:Uncharacterized protein LOC104228608 n=1 Tax=Nicotiana sylvestris TaxID=4096 RepID=A0A1U7WHG1_NICSY|nr:PREDICTED: uncharacterized protein LOC104228608 [Nicotiana sylvestris]
MEEGLHQAVILKFSYGKPDLQELRQIISKQFDVKGYCNIGQLEYRHILIRFDLFEDFVQPLSISTGFNPREETSRAVVWISLPDLPANFFAKRSLMSIASAVGKPLAVDKAMQDRTRPSTARVKVVLDLLDKHPKRIKIHIMDKNSGKVVEHYQEIVYDNLPKYCTYCKHQGHDERSCRWKTVKNKENVVVATENEGLGNLDKLQDDARDFLNAKRAGQLEDEAAKASLVEQ